MFKEDVFCGNREKYNEKLKLLAEMAEDEKWTFAKVKELDPYRVLRNYVKFTYDRLEEEGKLLISDDKIYQCMNTGLLTKYRQEIVGLFSKYTGDFDCKWYLMGFYKSSSIQFTEKFSEIPSIADYTNDVRDLVYDRQLEINVQIEHIIDDNFNRFEEAGYTDKQLINALLSNAISTIKLKLERNYKLALPFYYIDTKTNEKKIQLLVPLYMAGAPVKLALVLDKLENEGGTSYYNAITVLPVDWAYMNSRVIVRPEEEWAKIVDEVDNVEYDIEEKTDI